MSEKRIFANITDATSMILVALGFRSRRLRDFICGLQGVAGARREFDCTHLEVARRLDHNGKQETAETFVSRYLNALEREQRRTGKMLFGITRGGGLERKPTHYVDFITQVAVWVVQRARDSELWNESHTRAIAAFVPEAVEMLPTVEEVDEEMDNDSLVTPDAVRIARNRKHAITRACANFSIISDNQGDVLAHAESLANEILERARLIAERCNAAEDEASDEGVQICTPSDETDDTGRGTNLYPFEGESPEKPDMLAAALAHAGAGKPVFPVRADKTPRTANGFKGATTDERTICEWWRKWPESGIGIPTGAASSWLVLDIDPRHGGDCSLTELIEAHGALPDTLEARTGGGGHHIIFSYPQGVEVRNSAGKIGEGIDVRGEGGYIIAPPSLHASGQRYAWLNDHAPAPVPDWLLKLLTEERRKIAATPAAQTRPQARREAAAGDLIVEGNRNDMLFKIACSVRGKGAEYEEVESQLLEVNARRCMPALPVVEVIKIAQSVMRYAPNAVAVGA